MSAPGARHRILVEGLTPGPMEVTGEVVRYVRNVLRARAGEQLGVFDGNGRFGVARLVRAERDRLHLDVGALSEQAAPARRVTLGVAVPKRDRADWLVEKIAELGVHRLVWLECERSVSHPREGGQRAERWQRIVREACRQSGRSDLLEIIGPFSLDEWLRRDPCGDDSLRCITIPGADESLRRLVDRSNAQHACALIGPEGGWTGDELGRVEDAGYTGARMGMWTLRVETAAIIAAATLVGD